MTAPSSKTSAAPAAAPEELPVLPILKTLREGEFIDELNAAVQHAIDTSTELGKAATIAIKLTVTPSGRTVVIDDEINPKFPKPPQDATIYFLDKGNRLTRTDPKQTQFPAEAGFVGRGQAASQ